MWWRPSTNTSVQPEYDDMRPRGVTNHFCRVWIPDDPVNSDEEFLQLMDNIRDETESAVDRVMTCSPDYVVMGMVRGNLLGGRAGRRAAQEEAGGARRRIGGPGLRTHAAKRSRSTATSSASA